MSQQKNKAKKWLWPETEDDVLVRVAFLHVGQGASTVVMVSDGDTYQVLLVDVNADTGAGGIDVPVLLSDLLGDGDLHAFVNTHPHDDHLNSVDDLSAAVGVDEVWHSGHIPSKKFGGRHPELERLIKKVKKNGDDKEQVLEGSRSSTSFFDAQYHVLAPASYVTDEVNEDDAEKRKARIHEQCAVIKFGDGSNWVIITGDADRAAFENHITKYHEERLGAFALGASHHGSRTFFKEKEGDEPYLDGLNAIDPEHVFISAPTQDESCHDHPHQDAVDLYAEHVGKDEVYHTGDERRTFIVDIRRDGTNDVRDDDGELAECYGLEDDDGDDGDDGGGKERATGEGTTSGTFVPPTRPPANPKPQTYA